MSEWIGFDEFDMPNLDEPVWVFSNGVVQNEPFELILNDKGYFWDHEDFDTPIPVDFSNDMWQPVKPPQPPKGDDND